MHPIYSSEMSGSTSVWPLSYDGLHIDECWGFVDDQIKTEGLVPWVPLGEDDDEE